jgi:hypothetical protein
MDYASDPPSLLLHVAPLYYSHLTIRTTIYARESPLGTIRVMLDKRIGHVDDAPAHILLLPGTPRFAISRARSLAAVLVKVQTKIRLGGASCVSKNVYENRPSFR